MSSLVFLRIEKLRDQEQQQPGTTAAVLTSCSWGLQS
jgi:hypothetical protein